MWTVRSVAGQPIRGKCIIPERSIYNYEAQESTQNKCLALSGDTCKGNSPIAPYSNDMGRTGLPLKSSAALMLLFHMKK